VSTVAKSTWPVFMARLINRREVAEGTMAFQFERPSDWTFKAGQFVDITLINPPETDAEGNVRGFSIASAPQEPNLMITTRMRNTAFKRVLKAIPLQTQVKIEGPFGNLALHNNAARPAVLLAGGIGITPFRSIVVAAAKEKLPHRIFLFYSNRRPEDAPFLEELQALEVVNANYKLIATMTQLEKSQRPWKGETGLINYTMISKYLTSVASPAFYSAGPIYYIAGPPAMVAGLKAMLINCGIDSDDIRTEDFVGY
jgi:ferredoxin-NADP reductase